VRVPFFSGDFYVDGPVPVEYGVPVEADTPVHPEPPLDGETRAGSGTVRQVNYSSNAEYLALVDAYVELRNELSTLTTGAKWQRYLQLPLRPVPEQAVLDSLFSDASRGRLNACLTRYDSVRDDARFDIVAELPAFDRTHDALRDFVFWLDGELTLAADATLPPPEEVPLPPPTHEYESEPELGPDLAIPESE
jgi:hypothetical protein